MRAAVRQFVAGAMTLGILRRRTVPAVYDFAASGQPGEAALADELILRFAEADHGDWTEATLRQRLGALLYEQDEAARAPRVLTDADCATLRAFLAFLDEHGYAICEEGAGDEYNEWAPAPSEADAWLAAFRDNRLPGMPS